MSSITEKAQVPAPKLKQGDLFTGKWESKPPKQGDTCNVRLKPVTGEKSAVPGMASFSNEGPAGTYCKDCKYFGEIAVQVTPDKSEKNRAGCAVYSQLMRHAGPAPRRSIKLCPSCKYFAAADDQTRRFIVDQAGRIHRMEIYPDDLRGWRPDPDDTSNVVSSPALFTKSS